MKRFKSYKIISLLSALVFFGGVKIVNGGWFDVFDDFQINIANMIIQAASKILWLAGVMFNYSMSYTLNFKTVIDNVGVVDIGWKIFRDLSNMMFIFILLTISIATILGLQNYSAKQLLTKVILVALLMNFSLFTTKVIVDASNVFTAGFYSAITKDTQATEEDASWDKGISAIFSSALRLETLYKEDDFHESSKDDKGVKLGVKNIWTICIFGSLFLIVTAFVFFAASILFVKRMVILMFLMMLSPLAFLGMILPATSGYSKQWWQTLFKESFYAPLFVMFIYVVALGITDDKFKDMFGGAKSGSSFASVLTGDAGGGMSFVIFNFILIIGLMLASIITASRLGAAGAKGMETMGKSLNKWGQGKIKAGAGATTFGAGGRLARRAIGGRAQRSADKMEGTDYAKTARGKLHLKTLRKVGDSSFDARNTGAGKVMGLGEGIKGGYKTKRDEAQKAETAYAKSLKGDTQATDTRGVGLVDSKGAPIMTSRTQAYIEEIKNRSIFWRMAMGHTVAGQKNTAETLEKEYTNKRNLKEVQAELKRAKEKYEDARKKIGNAQYSNQVKVQQEVDTARDTLTNFENKVDEIKEKIKKATEKAKVDSKPKDKKKT